VQSKRTGSTLLQLVIKTIVAGAWALRRLTPKLLNAARRRLDVTLKNHAGQTIVHTLTEPVPHAAGLA